MLASQHVARAAHALSMPLAHACAVVVCVACSAARTAAVPRAAPEQTPCALGHARHADLAGRDHADGGRGARPAASTRCSCRCAAAATPITPARSSRAPPSWPAQPDVRSAGDHHRAGARAPACKVHAWVAVNLVSSAVDAAGVARARDLSRTRMADGAARAGRGDEEDRSAQPGVPRPARALDPRARRRVEGLYTSPLHPAAQDHTAAVIGEIAAKYAVDGVHLDYVRFPNEDFDYSPAALEQFKAAILPDLTDGRTARGRAREKRSIRSPIRTCSPSAGALPPLAPDGARDQVRTAVKAARPDAIVSAAVVPDAQQAFDNRGCRTGAPGSISR